MFIVCDRKPPDSQILGRRPPPTRSLGMIRSSEPCFRNTFPAVCAGLIPMPSFVMMALVAAGTLNSSAANFKTAVNGVLSGTLNTLYGNRGSDVNVILNVTFDILLICTRRPHTVYTDPEDARTRCNTSSVRWPSLSRLSQFALFQSTSVTFNRIGSYSGNLEK